MTFDLETWAERLYRLHVKRRNKMLVAGECYRIMARCDKAGIDPQGEFERIEKALKAWNATPEWRQSHGAYAPQLASWLNDEGYDLLPDDIEPSNQQKSRAATALGL